MRDPLPSGHRRVVRGEVCERALLRAHVLQGVVRDALEGKADRQRLAQRVRHGLVAEERKRRGGSPATGQRRLAKLREPGPKQAVADLQAMIEKAERPIGGEGRQPQRQPGELDRHRVEIDAVEAALRDRPSDPCVLGFADIGRVASARLHQRRLVSAREKAARRHQESAAAHCGIDNTQTKNLFGGRAVDQRAKRAADEIVGDRLRRVKRAGRLPDA